MLTHIWNTQEKLILKTLAALWLSCGVVFWLWWFRFDHIGDSLTGFVLTTAVLLWTMILPLYCFYFVIKMRRLRNPSFVPAGLRVAMIATKVPSEPLSLVKRTLKGMLSQAYPHETWVADEDPTPEALRWYKQNSIKVSCRKNDPHYHNETWPRRRKSKEGNLAYFYDKYGYKNYDVVVQFDADHVPEAGYLEHMLAPFKDKKVGYVTASSICDRNYNQSWSARARGHSEAMFHGPIQFGANAGWVPICIGSHYAVRTKALKQVGGIGPELAEDYSTTLLLNAYGWRGVCATEAEAHGEGPATFADLMVQDYQWSRSMTILLLSFYPKYFSRLSLKQKLQFTFTQLWYPVGALIWGISIILPIFALITGMPPVNIDFTNFLILAAFPYLFSLIAYVYVRSQGFLRPKTTKLFSWENSLFELARWPWVLIACTDAVLSLIFKQKRIARVTPKSKGRLVPVTNTVLMPYIVIVLINLLAMVFRQDGGEQAGYFGFALVTTASYLILMATAIVMHIRETKGGSIAFVMRHIPQLATQMVLFTCLLILSVPSLDLPVVAVVQANEPVVTPRLIPIHTPELSETMELVVEPEGVPTTTPMISPSPTPRVHQVQYGETLWSIAKKYYGQGARWSHLQTEDGSAVVRPGETVILPE